MDLGALDCFARRRLNRLPRVRSVAFVAELTVCMPAVVNRRSTQVRPSLRLAI
jgi:hypothetical protein